MKKTIKIKKMKKFIFSVIFLIVAVLTQAQGPGQTQTFVNPVIEMDFPDPDIIRVGGDYYMLSTTMHHFPGHPFSTAKTLSTGSIVLLLSPLSLIRMIIIFWVEKTDIMWACGLRH